MKLRILAMVISGLGIALTSAAETPEDRIGKIKQWKSDCAEEDADLRLAYVEAAIATEDPAIMRICNRLALQSDNADIRNLGLRASLASMEQIVFTPAMPDTLKKVAEKADADEATKAAILSCGDNTSPDYKIWHSISTGIPFVIEEGKVNDSSFKWTALVNTAKTYDDYSGNAIIVGSNLSWTGQFYSINKCSGHSHKCSISTSLSESGKLDGTLQCAVGGSFEISADLQ